MSDKFLSIEDLVIEYRTEGEVVQAVNGITLSMKKGETLGLVGETGAGKTTTALAIMRLLPPRVGHIVGGSITVGDTDILALPEHDMRKIRGEKIAMIYQDPMTSLNPVVTVGDQIMEVLELHSKHAELDKKASRAEKKAHKLARNAHKAEMKARVDELLEMVGIPAERGNEYPHQFSGGMKQRVVIAMALACEPELLIADEPTTALDVTIQAQVLHMIRDLKDKLNTSMLLITHDLGVVAQTCDKVAIMYAGEIVEQGSVEDIFRSDKHHPYTTGLFGSIPKLNEMTDRLSPIEGMLPDPTNLPQGCKFSPRCPHCMEICKTTPPCAMQEGSHEIACHLFDKTQGGAEV
ncbi:MAG: ABC transporter ATP-binding protein [Ruminococcaceae bacterium]|nr:ABC transporter ATP-binding protein [Oscillospiraceae bacterium]